MNQIILKGNIGNDPEVKTFNWGKVAKFSLATSETFKNKDGESVTQTDWHNIIFRGTVCDVIQKHLHKGDQVLLSGKIKYRSYEDRDKKTVWVTEVLADHFEFCGSRQEPKKQEENNIAENDPSFDPFV